MKMKELLFCLLTFVCIGINAMPQEDVKRINFKKQSAITHPKEKRSAFLEPSAFFYPDAELVLITFRNSAINAKVSVINCFTDETIHSDSYSTPEIILNLAGLLNEGDEYRLEITIGDTVLCGDFIY